MIRDEIIELYQGTITNDNGANNFNLWLEIYRGESYWINGDNERSLNLGALIPNELARPATIEFKSDISDERLQESYENLTKDIKKICEYGLALGDIIIKPYLSQDKVTVDVVTPDMFVPLDVDNFGKISRIAFLDVVKRYEGRDLVTYIRIEEHDRSSGVYYVRNKCFKTKNLSELGEQVSLSSVDVWTDLGEEAIIDVDYNLYGHFKNPQSNNLDLKSAMGVSCFSRAISLMQDADEQYNRLIWEYESKEAAIDADITMFKGGVELPKGKERLFRKLNAEDGFYEIFSPQIRDESLVNGLNEILKKIEDQCQLHRGALSEVDINARTATEITSSKQRLYAAVVDIQKNLEVALKETVRAIAFWAGVSEYEVSFSWDDSIVVSSENEQKIRIQEVASGLIKPEEYLKWRYGVEEEQAKEMMPEVKIENDLVMDLYNERGIE